MGLLGGFGEPVYVKVLPQYLVLIISRRDKDYDLFSAIFKQSITNYSN